MPVRGNPDPAVVFASSGWIRSRSVLLSNYRPPPRSLFLCLIIPSVVFERRLSCLMIEVRVVPL